MLLATVFALLSLSASMLIFINIIKSGNVIKIKEMISKYLIIGVSGKVLGLVLLSSCSIDTSGQQNRSQQQPPANNIIVYKNSDFKFYQTAEECIRDIDNYNYPENDNSPYEIKYPTYVEVISPNEFKLMRLYSIRADSYSINITFSANTVYYLLYTFAHTNITELTLHLDVNNRMIPPYEMVDPIALNNLPDTNVYKMTLHAKRKDVLAYLRKHYQINSFDELTDESDKLSNDPTSSTTGTKPSDKFVKIYSDSGKAWELINTFKVK